MITTKKGRVTAGEVDTVYLPKLIKPGRSAVIFLHGAGNPTTAVSANWPNIRRVLSTLKRLGYVVIAPSDTTSLQTIVNYWGNANQATRLTNAWNYAQSLGCGTKVHLMGVSMGHGAAQLWAAANTAKVASITGFIPMSNLSYHYTNDNPAGSRADIAAAWGVVYPAALPAGANIATAIATNSAAGIDTQLFYSATDPYVLVADINALVAAGAPRVTATMVDALGTGGHTDLTVSQADRTAIGTWIAARGQA